MFGAEKERVYVPNIKPFMYLLHATGDVTMTKYGFNIFIKHSVILVT